MIDALHISATGLRSQQEQIDVISNNVANMQTPGFKKGHVSFAEITGAQIENSKNPAPQTAKSIKKTEALSSNSLDANTANNDQLYFGLFISIIIIICLMLVLYL